MSIRVRQHIGITVFDAAVNRMFEIYKAGHRVICSFSGGKDSVCCLEICIIAAREAGRLPVEVNYQDEEVLYPGLEDFLLRTAARPEVKFHWIVCNQPLINIFNRALPYFWVFDPLLKPEQWMRQPPVFHEHIDTIDIEAMTDPKRTPPDEGKELYACLGLRVQESRGRLYGLFSSGSHITKPNALGTRSVRPIFDWSTGDVWKAIKDNKWDYTSAYDVLFHMGMTKEKLRIAPPTMNVGGIEQLRLASRAWPRWFDRLTVRLPGIRTAAQYGKRAITPRRRMGETWETTFKRECIERAPAQWLRDRAVIGMEKILSNHRHHSTSPLPDVSPCYSCSGNNGSWKSLAMALYNGDPFSTKMVGLPFVQPSEFRKGATDWTLGKTSF